MMKLWHCRRNKRQGAPKQAGKKPKFSKIAVVAVLVQVFVYTWVHLILSFIVGAEIAPTVSCAFYTFCGAEAGLLAWIKSFDKDKEKQEGEEEHEKRDFSEADKP